MSGPWEDYQSPSEEGPWTQFQAKEAPKPAPTAEPSSALERVGTGLGDVVWGAGQLAAHALPKGTVDTGIVDQMVKDRETEYAAKRAAAGSQGMDWARLAGNVANPINYALAGGAALPASLAGRVALGAAGGAAAGALAPTTGEDYWKEKGSQAMVGAATGGAVPVAGAALGRVINPQTGDAVKELMGKGITPTVGELLGPAAKSMEERLMSMPIVGDVISASRRGSIHDMNKALYNMALEPIGETSTAKIGREGISEVANKLSNAYNTLLTGKQVKLDQAFDSDLANVWNATSIMSNDARQQFKNIVLNKIINAPKGPNGEITGEMMKAIDSQLGTFARDFGRDQNINNRMIGDALLSTKDALRQAVARSNPNLADDIQKIDQGWMIYTRLRNASSRVGSKEGMITPGTLNAAVTALDKSVGKGATAKGTAPMREFTDQVNSVLGSTYPDSGTTGRAMMNLLLLGGGMYLHPASVMFGGAMTAPYLPGVKKAIAAGMTARPPGADIASNVVRQGAQLAAPGIAEDVAR